MATALGSNPVERAKNVIDNCVNDTVDATHQLRIVDAFAKHNEAWLLDWLESQSRPRDLAELTNTEKATNFLRIMTAAGQDVMRRVAEDDERSDVAAQIIAAGDTAAADFTE